MATTGHNMGRRHHRQLITEMLSQNPFVGNGNYAGPAYFLFVFFEGALVLVSFWLLKLGGFAPLGSVV